MIRVSHPRARGRPPAAATARGAWVHAVARAVLDSFRGSFARGVPVRSRLQVLASVAFLALACEPVSNHASPGDSCVSDAGCGDAAADAVGEVVQIRPDHTLPSFATEADFFAYAGPERAPAQVKFILRDFQAQHTAAHFEQPGFYDMHDEWSWFSLLNGIEIPGYDFKPVSGHSFATVADIVAWARAQQTLPFDLQFIEDGTRLYSTNFYDRAFNRSFIGTDKKAHFIARFFACGSVLHYDPDPRRPLPGELWLFETEYVDGTGGMQLLAGDVAHFFEVLSDVLPPGVGDRLVWLVRSRLQLALAKQIDAAGGPYAHRWATYDQVQVPGDSKTYNPGVAAGRVVIVPPGQSLTATVGPMDIVVLQEVPDDIPPVAAIVTNVPQTPLAHIGLLAKSRGTPNLYVAGAAQDDQMFLWAYYQTPVIVQATATGHRFREMSWPEWYHYVSLLKPRQTTIAPVDLAQTPELFDPLTATMQEMPGLVPQIGGKTAGFLALHNYPELDLPDKPFALTIKGYAEFMATFAPSIARIVEAIDKAGDARAVIAVLEGPDAYLAQTANSPEAQTWLAEFRTDHAADVLGQVMAMGGVRQRIMDAPMDQGYLARVTQALTDRFAFLSDNLDNQRKAGER